MMKPVKVIVAAVIVVLGVTLQINAQQDTRAAIEAANKQFVATFAKGDAAGLAGMYTTNGIAYPPNGDPVSGRPAIQKMWQSVIGMGVKGATLTTTEVEAHGDTAHEVGTYTMLADGGKQIDRGKYIVIWKREQGAWKLHRDIWNSSMPAATK